MRFVLGGLVASLFLFSCGSAVAESGPADLSAPTDEATIAEQEVQQITWWELLSPAEQEFWDEEITKYEEDSSYISTRIPPDPDINEAIDGAVIRLPGYVVGVDVNPDDFTQASSLLFVPFQGACIHVPPPPVNQTIFAEMSDAVPTDPFIPYWITGRIRVESGENELAGYSYVLDGVLLEEYLFEDTQTP